VLIMTAPAGKAFYKSLRGAATAQEKRIRDVLQSEKAAELRNMLRELLQ
jgi:MarR family transcriptional regulator, organic hydroperoxide resistance regulator